MDELKTLLGEELFKQVEEKLGDKQVIIFNSDEKYIKDDGNMIPKSRLDDVINKRNEYKDQLAERDVQLNSLKKKVGDNEKLKTEIENLQKSNKQAKEDLEAKELKFKKELAIKESLLDEGVFDSEARSLLVAKFDLDKIQLDNNGKIIGFSDLIKPIKENKTLGNLFGEIKAAGQEHTSGEHPIKKSKELATLEKELAKAVTKYDTLNTVRLRREIAELQQKENS